MRKFRSLYLSIIAHSDENSTDYNRQTHVRVSI